MTYISTSEKEINFLHYIEGSQQGDRSGSVWRIGSDWVYIDCIHYIVLI